jgi:Peptidase family M1 domain
MKNIFLSLLLFILFNLSTQAQSDRWQQHVKYTMDIDMNVAANQFKGMQTLEYTNNSPDSLNKVFYHLYWNAFQPGSAMDVHSREQGKIMVNGHPDWDNRVRDRIYHLKPNEIGYDSVISLMINGVDQPFKYHETILEVDLKQPIAPNSTVTFTVQFKAQVPLQVRRSGRDNPTTLVRYSMSQWYPKMCEYDYEGWHPTPYVAREFYGVWGDYDVTIHIAKNYELGGTGILANAEDIGWGYDSVRTPTLKSITTNKRIWHFIGNNVHDFVWAADTAYIHLVRQMPGGPTFNVLYKYRPNNYSNDSSWTVVADAAPIVFPYMERTFGHYPYPQYSFIQGGDGGMEYPMATLLVGPGLDGVFHEWMHSWFQMMLGTNESMYAWMDEGFTSYAEDQVMKYYTGHSSLDGYREYLLENPTNTKLKNLMTMLPEDHCDAYAGYFQLQRSGFEEPLTTHADHFQTNYAYSLGSYTKGEVFMEQLGYIVGQQTRDSILLEYYREWRFKHPNAADFFRVAEKVSGLKLDWYKEYWIGTTKSIDYGIDTVWEENGATKIKLKRIGAIPMPIDLQLTLSNGSTEMHYIPLDLMFGAKLAENTTEPRVTENEWSWTDPYYIVTVKYPLKDISKIEIDPSKRMADINRTNNIWEFK